MSKQINNIDDLTPDPSNANKGTERGAIQIEDSLRAYGAGRSIVTDKNGVTIGGAKTLQAAADMGLPIEVIQTDGTKLVVVQRTDLDISKDTRARELAYADNRTSEIGLEWNPEQIAIDLESGVNLDSMFRKDELDEIMKDLAPEPEEAPEAQTDRADELREKWQTERGQVWEIGEHRLMCGDCIEKSDLFDLMGGEYARLCVTSPPYNQKIDSFRPSGMHAEGDWVAKVGRLAYSDSMDEGDYQSQQTMALNLWHDGVLMDGSSIFYNHKNRYRDKRVLSPLEWLPGPFRLRQEIIWSRPGSVTQNARMFLPSDERIYWMYKGDDFTFNDSTEHKTWSSVWSIGLETNKDHAVGYPLELPQRCIRACSTIGDLVFDPYIGSGTTMVAAEQLGRVCYGMEIEPKYVAVAIERMSGMGLTPVLANG